MQWGSSSQERVRQPWASHHVRRQAAQLLGWVYCLHSLTLLPTGQQWFGGRGPWWGLLLQLPVE